MCVAGFSILQAAVCVWCLHTSVFLLEEDLLRPPLVLCRPFPHPVSSPQRVQGLGEWWFFWKLWCGEVKCVPVLSLLWSLLWWSLQNSRLKRLGFNWWHLAGLSAMCVIKFYCFWREPDIWLIHRFKGCFICPLVSHTHCYFRPVIQQCIGSPISGIVE